MDRTGGERGMMKLFYLGPDSRINRRLGMEPFEEELRGMPEADVIVSYRYRHIIPWTLLRRFKGRIINVHTSLLPGQRGAHPVFWAFMEGARHGVTVHEIDRGVDTGPIIFQVPVNLNPASHTFRSAWEHANRVAESAFLARWPAMLEIEPRPQPCGGSRHGAVEVLKYGDPFHWDQNVADFLARVEDEELSAPFWKLYFEEVGACGQSGKPD